MNKNIHILPTDEPTRLYEFGGTIILTNEPTSAFRNKHIYITSDEDIKDVRPHKDKWQLEKGNTLNKFPNYLTDLSECKLVILTTDPDLIKDGVQPIDDEFLEWFVKNPICEFVDVIHGLFNPLGRQVDPMNLGQNHSQCVWKHKIIIPKEKPKDLSEWIDKEGLPATKEILAELKAINTKQETLEEATERLFNIFRKENPNIPKNDIRPYKLGFIQGIKWEQEKMYNDAIEFGEYLRTEEWKPDDSKTMWGKWLQNIEYSFKTTKELFKIFKNKK